MTESEIRLKIKNCERQIDENTIAKHNLENEVAELQKSYSELNKLYKNYCSLHDKRRKNNTFGNLSNLRFAKNIMFQASNLMSGTMFKNSIGAVEESLVNIKNDIKGLDDRIANTNIQIQKLVNQVQILKKQLITLINSKEQQENGN